MRTSFPPPSPAQLYFYRHGCSKVEKTPKKASVEKTIMAGHNSSKVGRKQGEADEETTADWNTECQLCAQMFTTQSGLKTHLARQHYWTDLAKEFILMGDKCEICLLKFPTSDSLVYHMGNVHDKVNKYLVRDKFEPVTVTGTTSDLKCQMKNCKEDSFPTFSYFKIHLTTHFKHAMKREFPQTEKHICPVCKKDYSSSSSSNITYHMGKVHGINLKFAAFHFSDPGQLFHSLYNISELKKGVSYATPEETQPGQLSIRPNPAGSKQSSKPGPKSRKNQISESTSMQLKMEEEGPIDSDDSDGESEAGEEGIEMSKCVLSSCKCKRQFKTKSGLRKHLVLVHYRKKLPYQGTTCGNCDTEVASYKHLLKHVAEKHESALTWVLGKDGYVLPWRKHKVIPALTQNSSSTLEQQQPRSKGSVFNYVDCQLCNKTVKSSHHMKMHYLSVHFEDKLKKKYLHSKSDKCPVCKETLNCDGDRNHRQVKHQHIASNHQDVIMLFMQVTNHDHFNYSHS